MITAFAKNMTRTPFVQFVDGKGNMTKETFWEGTFVKDADPIILDDLKKSEKLFKAPVFEHSYPHCWRCDTPLIYYARESWFIKMTAVKENLLKNNSKINWIPPTIGTGRFGDWLEHVQDWGISRNRYWGTPLNIWECSCGHQHSIGSIEELKNLSKNCPENIELHRPYIDDVTISCEKCGGEMHRVPEVIDCWFDSGAMPFAQWHYPFENKKIFENHFPANFISEAVDQTRGWFYSLLAISTLLFDETSFENCIVLGLVLDKDGQKMSKSKGNAVAPMETLKKHGADAIRWYFYENSAPWLPNKFSDDAVTEGQRKFLGTLWNTYAFFVLYANIDDFNAKNFEINYEKLSVMDKWLLSKLNSTVKNVDESLANYKVTETAKILQNFIDELSNWYVRRSRARFWAKGMEQDKINAFLTLYTALVTFAKISAPMIPFITENIYRNLVCSIDKNSPESVHLCDFPKFEEKFIDSDLEKNMDEVLKIVVLGRAARNSANIKNRQPVAKMFVKAPATLPKFFVEIIEDELNVKSVEFRDDMEEFVKYIFKPNFRVLGKKVGKKMSAVKNILQNLNGAAAKSELDKTGELKISVEGEEIILTGEDIEISVAQSENFNCQSDNEISIALSTELTQDLIEEGFVREIISKVQTMRRDSNFEVTDRIKIFAADNEKLAKIIEKNSAEIKNITLADEIIFEKVSDAKDWDINGEKILLGVQKI